MDLVVDLWMLASLSCFFSCEGGDRVVALLPPFIARAHVGVVSHCLDLWMLTCVLPCVLFIPAYAAFLRVGLSRHCVYTSLLHSMVLHARERHGEAAERLIRCAITQTHEYTHESISGSAQIRGERERERERKRDKE